MSRVALIHTVPTVYVSFHLRVKEAIPGISVINTVDEFLASDPAEKGAFTVTNKQRLYSLISVASQTEADAIVTTCSTLSPHVEEIRPFFCIPIVTIDGEMLRWAVQRGPKIAVLATAESTIGPTTDGLRREARRHGSPIEIEQTVCPEAYIAIKARDQEAHDRIVLDATAEITGYDVIVLAQASMAHLEEEITKRTGTTTVSSPRFCLDELARMLQAH